MPPCVATTTIMCMQIGDDVWLLTQEAMQDWTAKYAGLVTSSQEGIPLVVATYMTRDFKMPMQLT